MEDQSIPAQPIILEEKDSENLTEQLDKLVAFYQSLSEDDLAKMPREEREELEDCVRSNTRHLRRDYYTVDELKFFARKKDCNPLTVQYYNLRADHQNPDNLIADTFIQSNQLDVDCERPILEICICLDTYGDKKAIAYCEKEKLALHPVNKDAEDEDERYRANYGLPMYTITEKVDIFGTIEARVGNLAHPIIQKCIKHWQFCISQEKLDPARAKIAKKHLAKIHKSVIKAAQNEAKQTYPYKPNRILTAMSFVESRTGKPPLPLYMLQSLWPILKRVITKENFFELLKEEFESWTENDPNLESYTCYMNRSKIKNFDAIETWYKTIIQLVESNQQQLINIVKSNQPESLVNWIVMKLLGLPSQDKAREYRSKAKKIMMENPKMAASAKSYLDNGHLNPNHPIKGYEDDIYFYFYDRPWKNIK